MASPSRCRYLVLWIALSATLIVLNKIIIAYSGFPYPVSLAMIHMLFQFVASAVIIQARWTAHDPMPTLLYIK